MTLPYRVRWAAMQELRSLAAYAKRTGNDLTELVTIPDDIRCQLEDFCEQFPAEAEDIQLNIAIRDFMLERIVANGVRPCPTRS